MRRWAAAGALVLLACAGCGSKERSDSDQSAAPAAKAPPLTHTTVNDYLQRGTPTFIAGTAGDDRDDQVIAAQIDLVRGLVFPDASVVADTEVGDSWPDNPVVYGGAHVNALVARLSLPLTLRAGRLELGAGRLGPDHGGERFGPDHAIAAVIPAAADHPEFLLLAGTNSPGVAGINARLPGGAPIVVVDAFGALVTGRWVEVDGRVTAELAAERARRLVWRRDDRKLPGGATASIRFLKDFPVDGEDALADAAVRGLTRAAARLGVSQPDPIAVYVYPDAGSKRSLTGDAGSGHAVVGMRALHVVAGAGLEQLLIHEGTHVLAGDRFAAERTPLLAEGLAVWVSGAYQGKPLADWQVELRGRVNARVADLLGPTFRKLPEAASYPVAGLLVGALIDMVGIEAFGEHLLGASAATWAASCARAGTSPAAVDDAVAALFSPAR